MRYDWKGTLTDLIDLMINHAVSFEGVDGVRMWATPTEWRVVGKNMILLYSGQDFDVAFEKFTVACTADLEDQHE